LASIGEAAMPTVPEILMMLASDDPETDPRGMQQRYLCFALFQSRTGMLRRSLAGVDRAALYAAVRAGLGNQVAPGAPWLRFTRISATKKLSCCLQPSIRRLSSRRPVGSCSPTAFV
jgi:hypothetical protein